MLKSGWQSSGISNLSLDSKGYCKTSMDNNDITDLAHTILNKHRRMLITALMKENGQHISQLAASTGIDRSTTSYHLSYLETTGIVQSEYKILQPPQSKGRAAHIYTLNTSRLRDALAAVASMTGDIEKELV